jgi:hypothetical protein
LPGDSSSTGESFQEVMANLMADMDSAAAGAASQLRQQQPGAPQPAGGRDRGLVHTSASMTPSDQELFHGIVGGRGGLALGASLAVSESRSLSASDQELLSSILEGEQLPQWRRQPQEQQQEEQLPQSRRQLQQQEQQQQQQQSMAPALSAAETSPSIPAASPPHRMRRADISLAGYLAEGAAASPGSPLFSDVQEGGGSALTDSTWSFAGILAAGAAGGAPALDAAGSGSPPGGQGVAGGAAGAAAEEGAGAGKPDLVDQLMANLASEASSSDISSLLSDMLAGRQ